MKEGEQGDHEIPSRSEGGCRGTGGHTRRGGRIDGRRRETLQGHRRGIHALGRHREGGVTVLSRRPPPTSKSEPTSHMGRTWRASKRREVSQPVSQSSVCQSVSQLSSVQKWVIVADGGWRSQRQAEPEGNHREAEIVHARAREGGEVPGGLLEVVGEGGHRARGQRRERRRRCDGGGEEYER